eukprot:662632-Prorocentrum_minimum.AAC.1
MRVVHRAELHVHAHHRLQSGVHYAGRHPCPPQAPGARPRRDVLPPNPLLTLVFFTINRVLRLTGV